MLKIMHQRSLHIAIITIILDQTKTDTVDNIIILIFIMPP